MQLVRSTFDSMTRCKCGRTTPDNRPTLSCRSTRALAHTPPIYRDWQTKTVSKCREGDW